MKGKIFLLIYGILSCIFIFGRILDYTELPTTIKYFLILPLIGYYIVSVKKVDSKFIVVLMLYFLGDILFTIKPEYRFTGFGAYLMANTTLSLLIMNRMGIFSSKNFFRILIFIGITLLTIFWFFYKNPVFQETILWIFYISVATTFVTAYLRHNKVTKPFSILMLLSTLLFAICNFLANMNYFVVNYIFFRALVSVFYVLFLLGITHSMVLEDKEVEN